MEKPRLAAILNWRIPEWLIVLGSWVMFAGASVIVILSVGLTIYVLFVLALICQALYFRRQKRRPPSKPEPPESLGVGALIPSSTPVLGAVTGLQTLDERAR